MVHQKEVSSSVYLILRKSRLAQLFRLNSSLVFFLCLLATPLLAQTARLSGTIVSTETGAPLSEIHVFIPNTTFQAFSDGEGN
jgi:hypothetical protein